MHAAQQRICVLHILCCQQCSQVGTAGAVGQQLQCSVWGCGGPGNSSSKQTWQAHDISCCVCMICQRFFCCVCLRQDLPIMWSCLWQTQLYLTEGCVMVTCLPAACSFRQRECRAHTPRPCSTGGKAPQLCTGVTGRCEFRQACHHSLCHTCFPRCSDVPACLLLGLWWWSLLPRCSACDHRAAW